MLSNNITERLETYL